jgi:hypothetical protein
LFGYHNNGENKDVKKIGLAKVNGFLPDFL